MAYAASRSVGATIDSLYRLIYAFVYRPYEPGEFTDPSYVNMIPNWEKNFATYTVRITGVGVETVKECPDFEPIYASNNPFETRTHIFLEPTLQSYGQTAKTFDCT